MFAADNETAQLILTSGSLKLFQLLPVIEDEAVYRQFFSGSANRLETPRFFQAKAAENATAFSTEAITVPYMVPQACDPSFATYYETTGISLQVWNVSSTDIAIDDNEESAWTPKEEETEYLEANIPIFVHTHDGTFNAQEPTHYLSTGARQPVFVDPASISELRRKGIADRDMLAPPAQARIITNMSGDIVKHRYYDATMLRGPITAPPYYVGDVRLRKVLARDNARGSLAQAGGLIVQG